MACLPRSFSEDSISSAVSSLTERMEKLRDL